MIFCLVLLSTFVTADLMDLKWPVCRTLNLTERDCDIYWDDAIEQVNISEINDQFKNYYNKTDIEQRESNFYNRTETINLIQREITFANITVNTTVNGTGYITKEDFDAWALEFRDSAGDNYANYEDVEALKEKVYDEGKSDLMAILWVALILIVIIVAYTLYQNARKKQKSDPTDSPTDEAGKQMLEIIKQQNKKSGKKKK